MKVVHNSIGKTDLEIMTEKYLALKDVVEEKESIIVNFQNTLSSVMEQERYRGLKLECLNLASKCVSESGMTPTAEELVSGSKIILAFLNDK